MTFEEVLSEHNFVIVISDEIGSTYKTLGSDSKSDVYISVINASQTYTVVKQPYNLESEQKIARFNSYDQALAKVVQCWSWY